MHLYAVLLSLMHGIMQSCTLGIELVVVSIVSRHPILYTRDRTHVGVDPFEASNLM